MSYKKYLYVDSQDNNTPVIVLAKKKPSLKNIPRSGTWVVNEFVNRIEGWVMPCFPEITWSRLKELKFVGEIK